MQNPALNLLHERRPYQEDAGVTICQTNPIVGDVHYNTFLILEGCRITAESFHGRKRVVLFPELSLIGYPPKDLVFKKSLVDAQKEAMDRLLLQSRSEELKSQFIVVGGLRENPNSYRPYNSAFVIHNGRIIATKDKTLLPTYDVFDEKRWFSSGSNERVTFKAGSRLFGLLICEDAWFYHDNGRNYPKDANPTNFLCTHPSDQFSILTLNASPSHLYKLEERDVVYETLLDKAKANSIYYANMVGGNDDLVFDGNSCIYYSNGQKEVITHGSVFSKETKPVTRTINQLATGIHDYVVKNGFKSVVVGSSGGIDSAVVIALAVKALGPEKVKAITMPSQYSSEGSVTDSQVLCDKFGVSLKSIPIKHLFNAVRGAFEQGIGEKASKLALENAQARIRGMYLMTYSNTTGALVLTTGNKSEVSVGYCTLYGDMCGGLNPLGDVYKMDVFQIAKELGVPDSIIHKQPSAELSEGQFDSDSLPSYPVLDAILRLYLEGDLLPQTEKRRLEDFLLKTSSFQEIDKVIGLVDKAEFKRQQSAPIIKVNRRSFGAGRDLPITQRHHSKLNINI